MPDFMTHSGFDWRAIKAARRIMKEWKEKEKGASTISMQTAKNTFLWHAEITCARPRSLFHSAYRSSLG